MLENLSQLNASARQQQSTGGEKKNNSFVRISVLEAFVLIVLQPASGWTSALMLTLCKGNLIMESVK